MNEALERALESRQPGLTREQIDDVERAIGVRVPEEIRSLWRHVGGGLFAVSYFAYGERQRCVDRVERLIPVLPSADSPGYAVAWQEYGQYLPSHLFPFADAIMGNMLSIDRRTGAVIFYIFDTAFEHEQWVAPSLAAFLTELAEDDRLNRELH